MFNGNDAPLHFKGAGVSRFVQYVWFASRGPGDYALYAGNARAAQPAYDVGQYISRLRRDEVCVVSLGDLMPNPLHKPKTKVLPWSERHRGILWLALIALVAILGLLVYRMAVSTGTRQQHREN